MVTNSSANICRISNDTIFVKFQETHQ